MNVASAGYDSTTMIPWSAPRISGPAVLFVSVSEMPVEPKVMRTAETNRPMTSCHLRQAMRKPTAKKSSDTPTMTAKVKMAKAVGVIPWACKARKSASCA